MTSRFRLALAAGVVILSGCGDYYAGPISYSHSPLLRDVKDDAGKPKIRLQDRVEKSLNEVFGSSPQSIVVPKGSHLPEGGARLASLVRREGIDKDFGAVGYHTTTPDGKTGSDVLLEGGYALYRKHCLHCHGVSGDGGGPTSTFLWPRPRDYRPGIFKFTSTNSAKPTRSDLLRILNNGIANSSMPSFEVTLTSNEMQQIIDYVIFLSARGETEKRLIGEAMVEEEPSDDKAESPINKEKAAEIAQGVFDLWKEAETDVLNPPIPRPDLQGLALAKSIDKGRMLFLGLGPVKLECSGCHGPLAKGDGPSFVPYDMFKTVVFDGDPALQNQRLEEYIASESEGDAKKAESIRDLWVKGSLDDWGNPLRPANLNLGQYKGGRRPLDIYWRLAKGINGAKMPSHANILKPEQIWDVVNFVLALPNEPDLLRNVPHTAPETMTTASATH